MSLLLYLYHMIRLLIGLFCLLFSSSVVAQRTDWKKDIRHLRKELPERHVQLFSVLSRKEFNQRLDWLEQHCNTMSDVDVILYLQKLMADLGDSHTSIELSKEYFANSLLPLHLYRYSDGYYVLYTLPAYKEMLLSRIEAINGFPVQQIEDSLKKLFPNDGSNYALSKLHRYLPSVAILKSFGFCADENSETKVAVKDTAGNVREFAMNKGKVTRQNRVGALPDSLTFIVRSERSFFDVFWRGEDSILYIMYNKCWSRELQREFGNDKDDLSAYPSFVEFSNKVFSMADEYPVSKLVMDLRYNGGGASSQGTILIKKMMEHKKLRKARAFVVFSRFTFSSAVLNALDMKEMMGAVSIGDTAGGTPNHYGEVKSFLLPSSGLKVTYSTKYFERITNGTNVLAPELKVVETFADFMSGEDAIYNAIREYH